MLRFSKGVERNWSLPTPRWIGADDVLVFPEATLCLYVVETISVCSMRCFRFSVPRRLNANAYGHDGGFPECCATSQLGTSWMRGTDDPVRGTKRVKRIDSFLQACYLPFSRLRQLKLLLWPVFRRALSSEEKLTSDSEYFTDQFLSLSCYGRDLSKTGLLLSLDSWSLCGNCIQHCTIFMGLRVLLTCVSGEQVITSTSHSWFCGFDLWGLWEEMRHIP